MDAASPKVYRYLNSNNEIIYVGKTRRPLEKRVREHKAEELWGETTKIEYIELPNDAIMSQYEIYYINLWKPKYNKSSKEDGVPIPMPEYVWITYYEKKNNISLSSYNLSVLEQMFQLLNNKLFNGKVNAYITYCQDNYEHICIDENTIYGNDFVYRIQIPEPLVINNDPYIIVIMITQMIMCYGLQNNIKVASNRGIYKNKRFYEIAQKVGLITKKTKYGFEPVDVIPEISKCLDDFGFEKVSAFKKVNNKISNTSTRKYIAQTGESVRATKDHILYCLTNQPQEVIDVAEKFFTKYGITKMEKVTT